MSKTPLNLFRYVGSKWSLSQEIIKMFPDHKTYMEPYFGSGAVFFTKQPSKIEVINDLNGDIVNFFQVLRNDGENLKETLKLIPFSRYVYMKSYDVDPDTDLDRAVNFFIKSWMGFSGTYHHKRGFKSSINPTGPDNAGVFKRVVDGLDYYIDRIRDAHIENKDALELIRSYGHHEDVLVYIDPPYLTETRKDYLYKHEVDDNHHKELLEEVKSCKASVLLSGYDNDLYNCSLEGWNKRTFKSYCSSHCGEDYDRRRTEVIWTNIRIDGQLRFG